MQFQEAAEALRAIISPENTDDVPTLRERVEQIKGALEKRAGKNQYQQLLVRAAMSAVVRYFDHGRPRDEREGLMRTLYRLERAAGVEQGPRNETGGSKTA